MSYAKLTPREREVHALMVQLMPLLGIALRLGISHRTVQIHARNIRTKLGVIAQ
jgi:DNA-binding CsgD family transcriptional regulator